MEDKTEQLFNTLKECMIEYISLCDEGTIETEIKYHIKEYKRYIKKMKAFEYEIEIIDSYKDGCTIEIRTNKENFFIDNRLFSETKGKIYLEYPKSDNSNIIENQEEIKLLILEIINDVESVYKDNIIKLLNI